MSKTKKKAAANINWFEIPADDLERAKKFYSKLFGWKINPIPGMADYSHIDTGGPEASPDGGMMARKMPGQTTTNNFNGPSVTRNMPKVRNLGGRICLPKPPCRRVGVSPSSNA